MVHKIVLHKYYPLYFNIIRSIATYIATYVRILYMYVGWDIFCYIYFHFKNAQVKQ